MTVLCKTHGMFNGKICVDAAAKGVLCGMNSGVCAHEVEVNPCVKCGGEMLFGLAISQTWTGIPDFLGGEVVTMSPGGNGKLVDCMKCVNCGWSVAL